MSVFLKAQDVFKDGLFSLVGTFVKLESGVFGLRHEHINVLCIYLGLEIPHLPFEATEEYYCSLAAGDATLRGYCYSQHLHRSPRF